jgi:two-component system sensor histidine kinase PilS (NtrC family)
VWNLCDNAWRHSQDSGHLPYFQIVASIQESTHQVFLEVIDSGPGIPEEIAEEIFEPFFSTQGTGLGLYLARELSERNGASLEYHPGPKGGSCFRICFTAGVEVNAA